MKREDKRKRFGEMVASYKKCDIHRTMFISSCPLCRRNIRPLPTKQVKQKEKQTMSDLKLIVDIRSMPNGGQLIARAGTVVDFLRENGSDGDVIAQSKDGNLSFPLKASEYEIVDDGRTRQEMPVSEDAVYMARMP